MLQQQLAAAGDRRKTNGAAKYSQNCLFLHTDSGINIGYIIILI